mgnify:CR=1 FL=1
MKNTKKLERRQNASRKVITEEIAVAVVVGTEEIVAEAATKEVATVIIVAVESDNNLRIKR